MKLDQEEQTPNDAFSHEAYSDDSFDMADDGGGGWQLTLMTADGEESYSYEPEDQDQIDDTALVEQSEEDILSARTQREFRLGKVSGVPEVMTKMEKQCGGPRWARVCIRVPVLFRRSSRYEVYVRLSTGKITNQDLWNAVKRCVATAAAKASVASAIAGIASGGAAALASIKPVFVESLKDCLKSKGRQFIAIAADIRVELFSKKSSGSWRRSS